MIRTDRCHYSEITLETYFWPSNTENHTKNSIIEYFYTLGYFCTDGYNSLLAVSYDSKTLSFTLQ